MFGEGKDGRSCPKLHRRLPDIDPSALNRYKGLSVVSQYIVLSMWFGLQYMKSEYVCRKVVVGGGQRGQGLNQCVSLQEVAFYFLNIFFLWLCHTCTYFLKIGWYLFLSFWSFPSDRNSPCCKGCQFESAQKKCQEAINATCKGESFCTGRMWFCPLYVS